MVAASANSPFLFGHTLWDETRIPLFEQAVDVGERYAPRVSFGQGYVQKSLLEIFAENQKEHLILLPAVQDSPPSRVQPRALPQRHLWRWNRPLIGFDFDGQVHLRIEHRVVPAGPTLKDCIANAAFYYGLICGFGKSKAPECTNVCLLPWRRDNFYSAARYGLNARPALGRRDGKIASSACASSSSSELLPLARRGLETRGDPRTARSTSIWT